MDTSQYADAWQTAVEGFNRGDLEPLSRLLADGCEFNSSMGPVGTSRDEIVARMREGLDGGWTSHNLLGVHAAGEFLTSCYRNDFSDGSSFFGAGVLRFGPDGKIAEIRSLEAADQIARASGT